MSELRMVPLSSIDPNPMRALAEYPFNEKKIEALMRSIRDVGLWEGVIARQDGNRYATAFGHHRVEAARRLYGDDAQILIIVRNLSDEEMIQFMGRENLEDYNADFLVMLESWEAADKFLSGQRRTLAEPIDIASLLGWLDLHIVRGSPQLDDTARACSQTSKLIKGGYLACADLKDLTVRQVRELAGRIVAQHETVERMAKTTGRPAREVEQVKKTYGKAGKQVAKDIRSGVVPTKGIRGQVDYAAYRHSREAKKKTPLFAVFGVALAQQVAKVAQNDMIAERFRDVKKSLGDLTFAEDLEIVKRLALECENASERFSSWHRTFSNPHRKVVKLGARK